MAKRASKLAARKRPTADTGVPITIGDNSVDSGGQGKVKVCGFRHDNGFTKISASGKVTYHVSAVTDEGCTVGAVDVPGIDPAEIHAPWTIFLGNGVIVRCFGDDVVELIFPSAPAESAPVGGKPTILAFSPTQGSAAILIPSRSKVVSLLPGDQIQIQLDTRTFRASLFGGKVSS
jgi:hypothetical protein